uniref:RNA-directed DNA polymerase n=1 Tax=Tanacetum cinerariifolium TaxID=118510 RepID=A0A699H480_TANCI|nr:RNA-directed DNA polymerase [Tanacetum cinerariifolium]
MGPSVYPLAQQNPQPFYRPYYQFGYSQGKGKTFSEGYGEYYNSQWTLPPAWTESGIMLVLLPDPGLWSETVSNQEGCTFLQQQKSFFAKLPPSLSKKIEESFRAKYPGLNSGVLPAIKFTHTFVSEMCKGAALAKELRDLSLCSAIPIPDFDDSNVYSISEGKGDTHQNISVMVQDTPIEEITFMAIEEDDESDSDQEEEDYQPNHHTFMFHPGPPTKIAEMVQTVGSWKPNKQLPVKCKECEHDWKENTVTNYTICYYCGILTTDMSRLSCPKCQLTTCALCARNYLGITVNVKGKQPQKLEEEKNFSNGEVKLLKELLKEKTKQVQQMIRDQAKEYYEKKVVIQKQKELWQSKESLLIRDLTKALKTIDQLRIEKERLEEQKDEEIKKIKGSSQIARPFMEAEIHHFGSTTTNPKVRKITNQLYNVKVEFDIPDCSAFETTAIIDAGASTCCINKKVVLKEALEPLTDDVFFNGLNSRQQLLIK